MCRDPYHDSHFDTFGILHDGEDGEIEKVSEENRIHPKKWLMVQFYRIQQAQYIVSPIIWALAIAGIWWPYLAPLLASVGFGPENVGLGIAVIFIAVLLGVLGIGYLYDRVLRLWVESTVVAAERNPYNMRHLTDKEIVLIREGTIPVLEALGKIKEAETLREWIEDRP